MTVVVLAVLGEIIELAAGALGVARTGGSRRSAMLALAGSLVGSVLGVVVGVPIPVVGSVIAAVLFAGMGAMAGAILGELSVGRTPGDGWQVGKAAFWGRLAGTLGKMWGRSDDLGRGGGNVALEAGRRRAQARHAGRQRHCGRDRLPVASRVVREFPTRPGIKWPFSASYR